MLPSSYIPKLYCMRLMNQEGETEREKRNKKNSSVIFMPQYASANTDPAKTKNKFVLPL